MQSKIQNRDLIIKTLLSLIGLNCAFFAAYYISFSGILYVNSPANPSSYRLLVITANLLFLVINFLQNPKKERIYKNYVFFVICYLGMIILLQGYELSRLFHLYFLTLLFVSIAFLKFSNFALFLEKHLISNVLEQKVILIGDEIEFSIIEHINSRPGNYKCAGLLSHKIPQGKGLGKLYLGRIDRLEEILSNNVIDEVLISTSSLPVEDIDRIIKTAEKYHATTSILPPYFQFLSNQSYRTEDWLGVPIISVYYSKLAIKSYQTAKRALDICFSLFFLAAVFPLLCLVVAPAIWLTNRGPIFFKQLRKGHKQKPFLCYKFRTMRLDTGIEEVVQAKRQDARVTAIGHSLRKTSIDEIPQFLNVLSGNMSVVGPRPHMVEHDAIYEKSIARYNVRFVAKPGITGWAQINGFRGSVENHPELLQKRIEYDLWYIKNWSIWLDLKIIYLTTVKLLFKGDHNAF